jgi:hypothetical protein
MLNKMKPTLALATLPTVPVVTAVFRIAGLIQTPRTFWNKEFNGLLPYFQHRHLIVGGYVLSVCCSPVHETVAYRIPTLELYQLGVAEVCMPPNQLMAAAMGFMQEIPSKSLIATVLAKHALNTIEDMSLRDGYQFEQNMTAEFGKYEDSKESMAAFAEK